ncbi:MAG: hypothetical protein DHS20C21_14760 [Gemmatimonadota bacterium]|nr:MAG: hypothetical protein DHS20C21_14760 [Gemmatimonadota bacterium]
MNTERGRSTMTWKRCGRDLLGVIVALFAVSSTRAQDVCLVPSEGNTDVITMDCLATPQSHASAVTGYSALGLPCQVGFCGKGPDYSYGWMVSSSATDPGLNTGELPDGLASLHLWLDCTTNDGMTTIDFDVQVSGAEYLALNLNPALGTPLDAGTKEELRLTFGGCPQGPIRVAEMVLQIESPTSVEDGRERSTWGAVRSLYR